MADDFGYVIGCLLITILGGWGAIHLAGALRANLRSGSIYDSNSTKIDRREWPMLYWQHTVAYVLGIVGAAVLGLGALAAIVVRFAGR